MYDKVGNWDEYVNYFNDVLDEELDFGATRQDIEKWHGILREYLKSKPNIDSLIKIQHTIGQPDEFTHRLIELIGNIENDERILKYVDDLYNDFE